MALVLVWQERAPSCSRAVPSALPHAALPMHGSHRLAEAAREASSPALCRAPAVVPTCLILLLDRFPVVWHPGAVCRQTPAYGGSEAPGSPERHWSWVPWGMHPPPPRPCPGSAPLRVPLLPSTAEPGFPLLAREPGLPDSRADCSFGSESPHGPESGRTDKGLAAPRGLETLAIPGRKGAWSPGPGPFSGSLSLLCFGSSPCVGCPVQDSSFCVCLGMLHALLQSRFLASLSVTLGLSSAPTAAASWNPKSPKCCFSSNPCH